MKQKNGFTLIELLAVIVILAIIALIATPIVLGIIEDSKNSSQLQSASFYLDSVENAIGKEMLDGSKVEDGTYDIIEDGDLCKDYNDGDCINKLDVDVNGNIPTDGTIKIELGKIKDIELVYEDKAIIINDEGELEYNNKICIYDSSSKVEPKTAGAKYSCEVKEGTNFDFYVLTTPSEDSDTINLIMAQNICEDGTATNSTKTDKCLVSWYAFRNDNSYGPITAMDYLYKATKEWANIPNIEMDYKDEGNKYGAIVTTNNITKIIRKDGSIVTVLTDQKGYSNLKARMPYKSEISAYDDVNKTNVYLYDYLFLYNNIQINEISGIGGYWTLSSYASDSGAANYVYSYGRLYVCSVTLVGDRGVRPVITIPKSKLN